MHGIVTGERIDAAPDVAIFAEPAASWVALLTESGAERKATIWLKVRQFDPYWPRYKGTVKLNRHRRDTRWRSVIAGYVFLLYDEKINWRLIENTPGIRATARPNGDKLVLTAADITEIRRIEEALNASPVAAAKGIPFKVGEQVNFDMFGRSFTGPILEIDKRGQISIEIEIFGRRTRVALTADRIEAV